MPVQLAKRTGLESHECSRNGLADWEVGRVNATKLAARSTNLLRLMLKGAVDIR